MIRDNAIIYENWYISTVSTKGFSFIGKNQIDLSILKITLLHMELSFTASLTKEDSLYVAQCLEIDIASQGESEEEALENLKEALELHFESPVATRIPKIIQVKAEVGAT